MMARAEPELVVPLLRLAAVALLLWSSPAAVVSARKVGETCALDRNCDAGLHCETCVADGTVRPRCTRVTPIDPQTKVRTNSRAPTCFVRPRRSRR